MGLEPWTSEHLRTSDIIASTRSANWPSCGSVPRQTSLKLTLGFRFSGRNITEPEAPTSLSSGACFGHPVYF